MTDIDEILNKNNPKFLAEKIAKNLKSARISLNLTQKELAERSGVSLSSLKRFEQKNEISLINLLKIAIILDNSDSFLQLFKKKYAQTLDDYIKKNNKEEKQRVRKKK